MECVLAAGQIGPDVLISFLEKIARALFTYKGADLWPLESAFIFQKIQFTE